MINELSKKILQNAIDHGFHENEFNMGERIALIHSEASEALEADRSGKYCYDEGQAASLLKTVDTSFYKFHFETDIKNTFEDELADIMIRVMELAAAKGVDLESHIKAKMRYNKLREYKHGKKY